MKHKSESFKKFKIFKNKLQNKLGKSIKALQSDRNGEYIVIRNGNGRNRGRGRI